MSYGAQVLIGIAMQQSGGNVVASVGSYHHAPVLSDDVSLEKATLISANLTGTFARGRIYDGINKVAGTIDCEATPKFLGALLTATVNDATAVQSGNIYTRTFVTRTADWGTNFPNHPISYYKQFHDSTSGEQYFDVQFSALEFNMSAGQLLKVKASVVGGSRVSGGAALNIVPVPQEFAENWMWDVASVTWGGSAQSNFSDIVVKIDEQIDPLYGLNASLNPLKFTRKAFRDVTVDGTFYMSDRAMFNDFISSTQRQLLVQLVNSRVMIQSGYYSSLTLDVPQLKVTQFKLAVTGPGEVAIKFQGMGVIDPTSNYTFQAILVNSFAPQY